ncbi:MAG: SRPBCC family protein [Anaerolineales bacterium]|nr:SRPBCC family protein [Anaerolineales bacterium]
MEHQSQFTVNAPVEAVRQFHQSANSLQEITPPLIPMTAVDAPDPLTEGAQIAFTLWFGPLPVRWTARIEDLDPNGFVDRQASGPFASWVHRHVFTALDRNKTRVDDHVTYKLKSNPFWWLVGGTMAIGLPLLFRYRAYKTRQILTGNLEGYGS